MARGHVTHLFSAAYDGELDAARSELLAAHLERCEDCAARYETFRDSIDALRALPAARMPRPVHVPSTAPVAERAGPLARLRGVRWPRILPGGATAIAAVAAAVILVLVSRQNPSGPQTASNAALPRAAAGAAAACASARPAAPVAVPASFANQARASEPGRPGEVLLLATQATQATPGQRVPVYALLTAPRAALSGPGGAAGSLTSAAAPCLSVAAVDPTGGHRSSAVPFSSGGAVAGPQALGSGGSADQSSPAFSEFTVPTSAAPGTVLHVTATVPAGYPLGGTPPLTVELVITVG